MNDDLRHERNIPQNNVPLPSRANFGIPFQDNYIEPIILNQTPNDIRIPLNRPNYGIPFRDDNIQQPIILSTPK
jgi:hypothetical protein